MSASRGSLVKEDDAAVTSEKQEKKRPKRARVSSASDKKSAAASQAVQQQPSSPRPSAKASSKASATSENAEEADDTRIKNENAEKARDRLKNEQLKDLVCFEDFGVAKAVRDGHEHAERLKKPAPLCEDLTWYIPGVHNVQSKPLASLPRRNQPGQSTSTSNNPPILEGKVEKPPAVAAADQLVRNQMVRRRYGDTDLGTLYDVFVTRGARNWELSKDPCKCNKSHCLKRYCPCFARGRHCSSVCACIDCHNVLENEHSEEWYDATKNMHVYLRNRRLATGGCACKTNRCLKFYCECRARSVYCGVYCECIDCNNYDPGIGAEDVQTRPIATAISSKSDIIGEQDGQAVSNREALVHRQTTPDIPKGSSIFSAATAEPKPQNIRAVAQPHFIDIFSSFAHTGKQENVAGEKSTKPRNPTSAQRGKPGATATTTASKKAESSSSSDQQQQPRPLSPTVPVQNVPLPVTAQPSLAPSGISIASSNISAAAIPPSSNGHKDAASALIGGGESVHMQLPSLQAPETNPAVLDESRGVQHQTLLTSEWTKEISGIPGLSTVANIRQDEHREQEVPRVAEQHRLSPPLTTQSFMGHGTLQPFPENAEVHIQAPSPTHFQSTIPDYGKSITSLPIAGVQSTGAGDGFTFGHQPSVLFGQTPSHLSYDQVQRQTRVLPSAREPSPSEMALDDRESPQHSEDEPEQGEPPH